MLDGCFLKDDDFRMTTCLTAQDPVGAFRLEVFATLEIEGKITDEVIENMMTRHHSGFCVHIGKRIPTDEEQGLDKLARYIIRACFSRERRVRMVICR